MIIVRLVGITCSPVCWTPLNLEHFLAVTLLPDQQHSADRSRLSTASQSVLRRRARRIVAQQDGPNISLQLIVRLPSTPLRIRGLQTQCVTAQREPSTLPRISYYVGQFASIRIITIRFHKDYHKDSNNEYLRRTLNA